MRMSKWLVLLLAFPVAALAQETSLQQTPAAPQQTLTQAQQENVARQMLRKQQNIQRRVITNVDGSVASGCPIGIGAQRTGTGTTMWTIAQEDAATWHPWQNARAVNVGVRVWVSAGLVQQFKQVELSVAYMPLSTRYMPVASGNPVETYMRKTFTLTAGDTPEHALRANLLVGAVGGVTRVYVTHVIYADGAEWNESEDAHCSVVPSRYLPVDSAK